MGLITTAVTLSASFVGGSAFILRKRISRNWVDMRPVHMDLTGKTFLITGGNTGLGFETAKDLYNRDANVIIACRDLEKGNKAVESITNSSSPSAPSPSSTTTTDDDNNNSDEKKKFVKCVKLDLSAMESVRSFIHQMQKEYKEEKIDTLVLNAGVWIPDDIKQKTKDGYEAHFGINHLSGFLLAKELKPILKDRIVFVSSSLMKSGKIDMDKQDFVYEGRSSSDDNNNNNNDTNEDDPKEKNEKKKKKKSGFSAPLGYVDTKLMNALTCRHMSTLSAFQDIKTYSVCPGFCRTSLGRNVETSKLQKALVSPLMLLIQRTSVQGAQNIIHLCIKDHSELQNGAIYQDGEVSAPLMKILDELEETEEKEEEEKVETTENNGKASSTKASLRSKLWELSEKLVLDDNEEEEEKERRPSISSKLWDFSKKLVSQQQQPSK